MMNFKNWWNWITGGIINENENLKRELILKNEEISKLNVVIERLKIRKDLKFPKTYSFIELNDAYKILKPLCSDVYLSDMTFDLTSKEEASVFTEETAIQYRTYITEKHDCDNFSFS